MIGMGLMGHGIAQSAATSGYQVIAIDVNPTGLQAGMSSIEASLRKTINKDIKNGKLNENEMEETFHTIYSRIIPSTKIDAVACGKRSS